MRDTYLWVGRYGRRLARNAVVDHRGDNAIAIGFAETADLIIGRWIAGGRNDLLFEPMVFIHRHALELILKAAIRETAARLRAGGEIDAKVDQTSVEDWLAFDAGHNLHKLASRLDELLTRLGLDNLPPDTHRVLISLHELDPRGDAFRYAKVRVGGVWVDAPRPLLSNPNDLHAHVDIVAMHDHFRGAFNLLSGGLMSVLENVADLQAEM